jgi:BCCT family betaine/carnitine transporter
VGCCVVLLALAAWAGLSKGIARVAEINVSVALGLLLLVLIAGPTLFILRTGTESIGFMLQNMMRMLTYTDPVGRTGFVEDWTIFYWAWWIAYGPFVGLFVARVSRGRTLRELIVSMSVFGSLGSAAFYVVLGNYALWLDLNAILPVREILRTQDPAEAISAVIGTLPMGRVAQFIFGAMAIVFIAATYNSKVYALAACTTQKLPAGQDPARWNRMFWAVGLGMLPIALMAVEGGIKVAKSAVLVASLPLLVVSLLMCMNLRKSLKQVVAEEAAAP